MVENLPATQEIWVRSLSREDPLKKEMTAAHSSILAWDIRWAEESGGLNSTNSRQQSDMTKLLTHTHVKDTMKTHQWGKLITVDRYGKAGVVVRCRTVIKSVGFGLKGSGAVVQIQILVCPLVALGLGSVFILARY